MSNQASKRRLRYNTDPEYREKLLRAGREWRVKHQYERDKIKSSAKAKEYRKKHPEKTREALKRWRDTHKEHVKQWRRAYTEKNKEKIRESGRRSRAKHRDKVLARQREWYRRNSKGINSRTAEYRKKNWPRLVKWHREHRRKLRELAATRPRPKGCELCDRVEQVVWDHDHKTGKFRGWICHRCNRGLAFACDDVTLLHRWIRYLKNNGTTDDRPGSDKIQLPPLPDSEGV